MLTCEDTYQALSRLACTAALAVNRKKKTGPKQAGVCCGTGSPNDYHDSGGNSVSVLHTFRASNEGRREECQG